MFKDKFNEEMQNISPSAVSKSKLLDKIKGEKERLTPVHPKNFTPKRRFAALAAAVAVVIVAVSVFNLPIFDFSGNVSEIEYTEGVPTRVTYNQIFNKFKEMSEREIRTYTTYGYKGEVVFEEDTEDIGYLYEDYDGAMPGGEGGDLGSENTTGTVDDGATELPSINNSAESLEESVNSDKEDFSTTNTQVEDVDEADIVKTDGKFIYYVKKSLKSTKQEICVSKAEKGMLEKASVISVQLSENGNDYFDINEVYLSGGTLVAILSNYSSGSAAVKFYDVSNPYTPKIKREVTFSGSYLSSRLIKNNIYLFTNEYFYGTFNKDDICSYVPSMQVDGAEPCPVAEEDIYIFNGAVDRSYSTVFSLELESGEIIDSKSTVGGGNTLYANTKTIYLAANGISGNYYTNAEIKEYKNKTRLISYAIDGDGKITPVSEGCVDGTPLNQFSMDEYNGYFRIVTTVSTAYTTTNSVYILNKELKTVGSITDIAEGERVYSVRFMGDTGYFVTFRQVDPLFAVDLKDPQNPKILSALKIPGFSNYMHPWGEGLLLGIGANADEQTGATDGVKLSMFDISNPEKVSEKHKEIVSVWDSSIGENHKAILVNYEKNFIGFASGRGNGYYLYGYDPEKGFELKTVFDIVEISYYAYGSQNVRGIYIGEYFYVCSDGGINSYSLKDYFEVDTLIY